MASFVQGGSNDVAWTCSLTPGTHPPAQWRRSSIICTIGPKTNNPETMNQLRKAGMNVVRMNFSHGEYTYHQSVIDNARLAETQQEGRPLAIALDTKGPEIRTGQTEGDADLPIAAGAKIVITCDDAYKQKCSTEVMYVDYKNICKVIEPGRIIYVDDGVLSFQVDAVREDAQALDCTCLNNGRISSRKGVNLPGTDVDLPALSDKDKKDLAFGVENNVDMIFASFIRRADDIKEIRKCLGDKGKEIRIIAKIENRQGVNNFDEILRETDGVMVARGDLGIEIPAPEVVLCQKMMIAKCNLAGKPVICATQMLESMTYNPRPTRAEVSDVANAILDGADCVMLSGETAKGSYPIEAVRMMHETTIMAETAIRPSLSEDIRVLTVRPTGTTETVCCSAVNAAYEQSAAAIVVLSTSGDTARYAAKYKPAVPIIMVTRNPTTARNGHLHRGVWPFLYTKEKPKTGEEWQEGVDERLKFGFDSARKLGILKANDIVVAVQGWRGGLGNSNTLRILQVTD